MDKSFYRVFIQSKVKADIFRLYMDIGIFGCININVHYIINVIITITNIIITTIIFGIIHGNT